MSKFPSNSKETLAVGGERRSDPDEDGSDEGSHHSERSPPTTSQRPPKKFTTQAELKTQNPHYLCPVPTCDTASTIPSNLSQHYKRMDHANDLAPNGAVWGPWNKQILANVRMVQDGVTFRYGDRHLHTPRNVNPTQRPQRPQRAEKVNPDFTDEAILSRATHIHNLTKPSTALDKANIMQLAMKMKRDHLESGVKGRAEVDRKIAHLEDSLARSTAESRARNEARKGSIEGRGITLEPRSPIVELSKAYRQKLLRPPTAGGRAQDEGYKPIKEGRETDLEPKSPTQELSRVRLSASNLARKVRGFFRGSRSRSPEPNRPKTSTGHEYHEHRDVEKANPSILRRRSSKDSQAPLIPYHAPPIIPKSNRSKKAMFAGVSKQATRKIRPDESLSSEESEVSEEE